MTSESSMYAGSTLYLKEQIESYKERLWLGHFRHLDGSLVIGIDGDEIFAFGKLYEDTKQDMRSMLKVNDDKSMQIYCSTIIDEFPLLDSNRFVIPVSQKMVFIGVVICFILFPVGFYLVYLRYNRTKEFADLLSELQLCNDKLVTALTTPNFSAWINLKETT